MESVARRVLNVKVKEKKDETVNQHPAVHDIKLGLGDNKKTNKNSFNF